MEAGKEKGFVLYDEVNELLAEDFTSGREFEDLLTDLDSAEQWEAEKRLVRSSARGLLVGLA